MVNERASLVTGCGRRLAVGRFVVPVARLAGRVTLRADPVPGCCDAMWVSLTAAEARRLAQALQAQAGAIERGHRGVAEHQSAGPD